jgi:hypothetical protein
MIYIALVSSPLVVASSLQIGGDGEGLDFMTSTEVMPFLSVGIKVHANIKWFPFGGEGHHKD